MAVCAVSATQAVEGQHRVGQALRLAELELEVGRGQHRRELFHARQRLDAALRLLGLAGLGLEAVDEALQVRDAFLLLAEGGCGLRQPLGAHLLEGAVVAGVAGQRALVQVHGDAGDRVEELAVVADDDHRAFEALEPGFQPDQRVQVQVVGRLVQQQQVGRAHQRARQLQPHAPAAGEAVHRRVELVDAEAQAEQQRLRARIGVEGAGFVQQPCAHRPWRGRRRWPRRRAARPARAAAAASPCSTKSVAPSSVSGIVCATSPMRQRGGISTSPASACSLSVSSRNRLRLAGAVAADQADLLARVQRQVGALQHDLGAAAQRQVAQRDHASVAPRAEQQHLVVAGAGAQPQRLQRGKGGFEVRAARGRSPAPARLAAAGAPAASASSVRTKSMPSAPPASASAGSARYSAGSAAIDVVVHVGRVAQDQVVAAVQPRPGRRPGAGGCDRPARAARR